MVLPQYRLGSLSAEMHLGKHVSWFGKRVTVQLPNLLPLQRLARPYVHLPRLTVARAVGGDVLQPFIMPTEARHTNACTQRTSMQAKTTRAGTVSSNFRLEAYSSRIFPEDRACVSLTQLYVPLRCRN